MTIKYDSDTELLSKVYIAAPCPVSWESMEGDDVTRHCKQCHLNVYNFAEMSEKEAADVIRNAEGRLCVRLFRRMDGTLITRNCPKGVKLLKAALRFVASFVLGCLVWFGLMDSANAQGLVGAPVDPRYGANNEAGSLGSYYPLVSPLLGEHPLIYSYDLTVTMFFWGYIIKHRLKLSMIGLAVCITAFLAGLLRI